MHIDKVLYRAHATTTGGRIGHVISSDRTLDLNLSIPKDLGGPGGAGTNPEQLFAAGYSACFLSAMQNVARREKVVLPANATVEGNVGFGVVGSGYGIEVELRISLPDLPSEQARALVEKAYKVCPYSNATRGNIDVTLTVV
jgi:osmotically inducible protein OsmC